MGAKTTKEVFFFFFFLRIVSIGLSFVCIEAVEFQNSNFQKFKVQNMRA